MPKAQTARELALATSRRQRRIRQQAEREQELNSRTQDVQGRIIGRNPQTGAFVLATPDGGTVEAFNLGTGAPDGDVPIQRSPGGQKAYFQTPSTSSPDYTNYIEALAGDVNDLKRLKVFPGYLTIINPRQNRTYTLIRKNKYPLLILADPMTNSEFLQGSGTFVFSHGFRQVIEQGEDFTVTLSNLSTDGGDPPQITANDFVISLAFTEPGPGAVISNN
jgi:hypothetical protein